jgi:DNA polymerase (family 10)
LDNRDVALLLETIAGLLELQGEGQAFRARAYRRAARSILGSTESVAALAAAGRLTALPGIGRAIAGKIEEFLETGTSRYLEELRLLVPAELLEVVSLPGVGPRTAILLHRHLGIVDREGLAAAARDRRLRTVPGIGPRREAAIREEVTRSYARQGWVPLPAAHRLARERADWLRAQSGVTRVEVAGDVRRWRDTCETIVLLATGPDLRRIEETFRSAPSGEPAACPIELVVAPPGAFAVTLVRLIGSAAHWQRLIARASALGLRLDERGLFRDGQAAPLTDEAELYELLGLQWIPPELREDRGEIEAAAARKLPRLLELADVRGDLHAHSDWSDGLASLEDMAEAARGRGYAYLAITDHSPTLAMIRGLDEPRLRRQVQAIASLNQTLHPFCLLTGIEVDLLADGRTDLPAEALHGLDVVIGSVHTRLRLDREAMTGRFLRAAEEPAVDALGHLTGRLIGQRDPYELDLDRVLEACRRTGTWLEINASPERLDVDDGTARKAKEHGVKLVLGTDAHAPVCLEDMVWGVAIARRAWLGSEDVVNCLPPEALAGRGVRG